MLANAGGDKVVLPGLYCLEPTLQFVRRAVLRGTKEVKAVRSNAVRKAGPSACRECAGLVTTVTWYIHPKQ